MESVVRMRNRYASLREMVRSHSECLRMPFCQENSQWWNGYCTTVNILYPILSIQSFSYSAFSFTDMKDGIISTAAIFIGKFMGRTLLHDTLFAITSISNMNFAVSESMRGKCAHDEPTIHVRWDVKETKREREREIIAKTEENDPPKGREKERKLMV